MKWALAVFSVALVTTGCGEPETPLSPTENSVESFLRSLPPPFVGQQAPNYTGTWQGEYRRVGCRATFVLSCMRDAPPRNERIEVSFVQVGTTINGTLGFPGSSPFGSPFSYSSYVTTDGIAGTATRPNPPNTSSQPFRTLIVVFLRMDEEMLGGSIYDDGFSDQTGARSSARKYDFVVPLRRAVAP